MSTIIESITTYTGYLYDAEGNRVAKGSQSSLSCDITSNGFTLTKMFVLGPDNQTMTETDGSGNWQHTDVSGAGMLLASYDADSLNFNFSDWLGTRRVQIGYNADPESQL